MKVSLSSILMAALISTNSVSVCSAQDRQVKLTEGSSTTSTVVIPSTTELTSDDGNSIVDPGKTDDGPDSFGAEPTGEGGRVSTVGDLKESGPRIDPKDGWAGDWNIDTNTDVDMMAGLFNLVLKQGSVGYSFSIFRNGSEVASGAGGNAKLSSNGSLVAYTTQTRQEVASLSKTITAMAVLQALEDVGLDPFEPIVDFLPIYWDIDETISSLTFVELLSHHSGLLNVGSWPTESEYGNIEASLSIGRSFFEFGPEDGYAYQYNYQNVNYAVARYLLAYLVAPETMLEFEEDYDYYVDTENPAGATGTRDAHEACVQAIYMSYVRDVILVPSGVNTSIDVFDWDSTSPNVRYYNFLAQSIAGLANDDNTLTTGPRGFVMQAKETAQVMARLETGDNVSTNVRDWMKLLLMGFLDDEDAGRVFYYKTGGNGVVDYYGRGCSAVLVLCPGNIQVAIHTNSSSNYLGGASWIEMVEDVYDAATID
ncbi:MAG: serine hydrolase [Planctomycetales bacterium]|nr:serine hydrolase [Planctomycetales bacterium]